MKLNFLKIVIIASIGIAIIIALALSGAKQPQQIACTDEAKLCPDGLPVARTGPNCEFAKCPEMSRSVTTNLIAPESSDSMQSWETYRLGDGFEFKYPSKCVALIGREVEGEVRFICSKGGMKIF